MHHKMWEQPCKELPEVQFARRRILCRLPADVAHTSNKPLTSPAMLEIYARASILKVQWTGQAGPSASHR
jgi:hypothetical protein